MRMLIVLAGLLASSMAISQEPKSEEKETEVDIWIHTVVDGIEFVDLPLDEALEHMRGLVKKASGKEVSLELIEQAAFGNLPSTSGPLPPASETLITIQMSSSVALDTLRYVVQLGGRRTVAWNERIFVVPAGADLMKLGLVRLDRASADDLLKIMPVLDFNSRGIRKAKQPGAAGYVAAFKNPALKNRGFEALEEFLKQTDQTIGSLYREGSFAGMHVDHLGVNYLVMYNDPGIVYQVQLALSPPLTRREQGWRKKLADQLSETTGWERVEACLEINDQRREDLMPRELQLLTALSRALATSTQWDSGFDIDPGEIENRKKIIRKKMEEAADRLIESLRYEYEARQLIPVNQRLGDDPFAPE